MKFLKFVLKYWKETLIVSLILFIFAKSKFDYYTFQKLEKEKNDAHELSIQQLKDNYDLRIKEQKEAYDKYKEEVDIILEHYDKRVAILEDKTSKRQNEYQIILKEKPETLIKEIEQKFGFKYVE